MCRNFGSKLLTVESVEQHQCKIILNYSCASSPTTVTNYTSPVRVNEKNSRRKQQLNRSSFEGLTCKPTMFTASKSSHKNFVKDLGTLAI